LVQVMCISNPSLSPTALSSQLTALPLRAAAAAATTATMKENGGRGGGGTTRSVIKPTGDDIQAVMASLAKLTEKMDTVVTQNEQLNVQVTELRTLNEKQNADLRKALCKIATLEKKVESVEGNCFAAVVNSENSTHNFKQVEVSGGEFTTTEQVEELRKATGMGTDDFITRTLVSRTGAKKTLVLFKSSATALIFVKKFGELTRAKKGPGGAQAAYFKLGRFGERAGWMCRLLRKAMKDATGPARGAIFRLDRRTGMGTVALPTGGMGAGPSEGKLEWYPYNLLMHMDRPFAADPKPQNMDADTVAELVLQAVGHAKRPGTGGTGDTPQGKRQQGLQTALNAAAGTSANA
jgi:hypothetical protein